MRGDGDNPIIQSPFMNSLGILILFVFLIPGLVYGMIMRNIKSDKDVVLMGGRVCLEVSSSSISR